LRIKKKTLPVQRGETQLENLCKVHPLSEPPSGKKEGRCGTRGGTVVKRGKSVACGRTVCSEGGTSSAEGPMTMKKVAPPDFIFSKGGFHRKEKDIKGEDKGVR